MDNLNPTPQALNARLNPTPVSVQTPSTTGLFRSVGDFGTQLFKDYGNGVVKSVNLLGDNSPIFSNAQERASFGNAGGQAAEAVKRLKDKYGIDYNSLNQVNLGDLTSTMNQKGSAWWNASTANQWDTSGFKIQQGDYTDFFNSPQTAQLTSQTLNTTPNQLAPTPSMPQTPVSTNTGGVQNLSSQSLGGSPTSTYQGSSIVDYLNSLGKSSDYNSRASMAQQLGISNYTGSADQNLQMLSMLRAQESQGQGGTAPQSSGSATMGTINPNVPINLGSANQTSYPSSVLSNGMTTGDVLNKTQSYNDTINGYLKAQADAQAQINNAKLYQLQQTASIRNSDSVTPLQGQDLAELEKQMAFRLTPAEIALQNAQLGLQLFKQSPQYLTEQSARDTAYNLLQTYPDTFVQYDPSKSGQENLAIIRNAISSQSTKYQASLMSLKGYYDPNGVFHTYNSKGVNPATGQIDGFGSYTPSSNSGQAPIITGQSYDSWSPSATLIPTPTTKEQASFVTSLTSGQLGTQKNALNTAIGHLFEADETYPLLSNSRIPIWNSLANKFSTEIGQKAQNVYEQAQNQFSAEISNAYGAGALSDRLQQQKLGGSSESPAQHAGWTEAAASLLSSKVAALVGQYKDTFGSNPPNLDLVISPLNQVRLSNIGVPIEGLVPGVGMSESTRNLMNNTRIVNVDADGNPVTNESQAVSKAMYFKNGNVWQKAI